ncbi:MAG TPA: hypothetical protein VL475_05935 [Planctomycetaceae bacterium]|nr:hypothetical protein [Planctomycetaceae bacterium]
MQRDMKVGMALGVALVGIVGALFFRRDPAPPAPPPSLQGAEELDKQISEKAKSPYIQGLDEFVDPPAPPPAQSQSATTKGKAKGDAYKIPDFLTGEDEAEQRAFLSAKHSAAPDPIVPPGAAGSRRPEGAGGPEPAPAHNRDWLPDGVSSPSAPKSAPATAGNGDSGASRRTHVTQPGETLSGLAARYLGSSARYRELYEANRNVLRSPDDLPDGVTLVIPETVKPSGAPSPGNHTAETPASPKIRRTSNPSPHAPAASDAKAPAVSGDVQPGKLRFAPVTRGPFSAGRTSAGNRAATPGLDVPPPPESKPSRPRIELDDSDPFQ